MKYKILVDFGPEGFKFEKEEFDTLDEAVKMAVHLYYCHTFLIVNIVDWKAVNS